MTVWIRIALYILAGWLYGSGYIGTEVRDLITNDPAVSVSLEAGVAAMVAGLPVMWWRLAHRFGWST